MIARKGAGGGCCPYISHRSGFPHGTGVAGTSKRSGPPSEMRAGAIAIGKECNVPIVPVALRYAFASCTSPPSLCEGTCGTRGAGEAVIFLVVFVFMRCRYNMPIGLARGDRLVPNVMAVMRMRNLAAGVKFGGLIRNPKSIELVR